MILKFLLNTRMIRTIYEKIEEYNLNKERKIMIVFDDMIADFLGNKMLQQIVTDLFIRGRKLNISFGFSTQSYFAVPKNNRLNALHCFIMNISNKQELQQIAFHDLSDTDFKDFMSIFKKM